MDGGFWNLWAASALCLGLGSALGGGRLALTVGSEAKAGAAA